MGYETSITLEGVRVKSKHLAHLRAALQKPSRTTKDFYYILTQLQLREDGVLQWAGEPSGKWYRMDEFATWLAKYCESGKVIVRSCEGDGDGWGYQFDGAGGLAVLDELIPAEAPQSEISTKIARALKRLEAKSGREHWLEFHVNVCFWFTYHGKNLILETNDLALKATPDPEQAAAVLLEHNATATQTEMGNGEIWTFYRIRFEDERDQAAAVAANLIESIYGVTSSSLLGMKLKNR